MAERIWVTVQGSADHPDVLTVQDAMRQVLDVFDLLPSSANVVWNMFQATKVNPFTVGAEAVSPTDPALDVRAPARQQKTILARQVRALAKGRQPPRILESTETLRAARQILQRNTNGIGTTTVRFDEKAPPLVIDEPHARKGLQLLEARAVRESRPHVEIGSIEGRIVFAGWSGHEPAIIVRDRRTQTNITCRIPSDIKVRVAKEVGDLLWDKRRVIVRGRIRYKSDSSIDRVDANDVELIEPRADLSVVDILDEDFTSGLDTAEYLERLWEGELG